MARPPSSAIREARASMRSPRRAASATEAPRSAYMSAVASPIPEDAPVIATTLPSSIGETLQRTVAARPVLERPPCPRARRGTYLMVGVPAIFLQVVLQG